MQQIRPKAILIRDLMEFANTPIKGRGGWPHKLRQLQRLALEAGLELAKWGRPQASRKAQPSDLFAPKRADAGLPL